MRTRKKWSRNFIDAVESRADATRDTLHVACASIAVSSHEKGDELAFIREIRRDSEQRREIMVSGTTHVVVLQIRMHVVDTCNREQEFMVDFHNLRRKLYRANGNANGFVFRCPLRASWNTEEFESKINPGFLSNQRGFNLITCIVRYYRRFID